MGKSMQEEYEEFLGRGERQAALLRLCPILTASVVKVGDGVQLVLRNLTDAPARLKNVTLEGFSQIPKLRETPDYLAGHGIHVLATWELIPPPATVAIRMSYEPVHQVSGVFFDDGTWKHGYSTREYNYAYWKMLVQVP